jgi:nucleotide-binding universal stress UspA family protein
MLNGLEGIEILLYHCCVPFSDSLSEDDFKDLDALTQRHLEKKKRSMKYFFDEAEQILVESGVDSGMIKSKFQFDTSISDRKVSKRILSDMKKEKCGSIVIGRKGSTRAREYSMGSVCRRTLSHAENCALWIL